MAGTIEGGRKSALVNKLRYGEDFYARIGAKGGRRGTTGGFAANIMCYCLDIPGKHKTARCAGKRGGSKSRRRKKGEAGKA